MARRRHEARDVRVDDFELGGRSSGEQWWVGGYEGE